MCRPHHCKHFQSFWLLTEEENFLILLWRVAFHAYIFIGSYEVTILPFFKFIISENKNICWILIAFFCLVWELRRVSLYITLLFVNRISVCIQNYLEMLFLENIWNINRIEGFTVDLNITYKRSDWVIPLWFAIRVSKEHHYLGSFL